MVSRTSYSISGVAAVAIVLLRIGIGVHFLSEGWTKLQNPKPFSAGFFGNAKGPFAPLYKNMVWDADGLFRLDFETTQAEWEAYRDRVAAHYGFDDKQQKSAADTTKRYEGRLKQFLGAKSDTIDEYQLWLERRAKNSQDKSRQLTSLQAHDTRIAGETRKLWAELVPPIDRVWKDLENDLNALATDEQWKARGRLAISKPGRRALDTETMDRVVPWFDLGIGICLILGLLTPVAGVICAMFLASICASQWPLAPGAAPIYNQAIEMLALLALAAVGAGRFFGLDAFICPCKDKCATPKQTLEISRTKPVPVA